MADIRVKKVVPVNGKLSKRELYATICYHYPQYTLKEVASLPARDVQLLFRTFQKQQAILLLNLTQIAAAPHTEKGKGVASLIEQYKEASK